MENNNEILPIPTTTERFFYEYLKLKKPILEYILGELNKKTIILNPKLMQVFAMLLYYNHKYKHLPDEEKWRLIFENGTRKHIADKLNINSRHLNTYLSTLRNIKLLDGKKINKPFVINPGDEYSLTYKFIINNE